MIGITLILTTDIEVIDGALLHVVVWSNNAQFKMTKLRRPRFKTFTACNTLEYGNLWGEPNFV